jgi:hypothetical protein
MSGKIAEIDGIWLLAICVRHQYCNSILMSISVPMPLFADDLPECASVPPHIVPVRNEAQYVVSSFHVH